MSIGTSHVFNPLGKDSCALSGQRLVRLIAKANRDGKYASPHLSESLCVSVPRVTEEDILGVVDVLMPHVIAMGKQIGG